MQKKGGQHRTLQCLLCIFLVSAATCDCNAPAKIPKSNGMSEC